MSPEYHGGTGKPRRVGKSKGGYPEHTSVFFRVLFDNEMKFAEVAPPKQHE